MTMHFEIVSNVGRILDRALVYRPEEYSFDTVPASNRGFTSVLLDDLNLEIDDSNHVIAVWGMCPHTRWIERVLEPPIAQQNSLVFTGDYPFERGVSVKLNAEKYLPVYVDKKSGWIQIKGTPSPSMAVTIFTGVVVELTEQGELCSLWLKPERGMVR
jgi:hypothetical protein